MHILGIWNVSLFFPFSISALNNHPKAIMVAKHGSSLEPPSFEALKYGKMADVFSPDSATRSLWVGRTELSTAFIKRPPGRVGKKKGFEIWPHWFTTQ